MVWPSRIEWTVVYWCNVHREHSVQKCWGRRAGLQSRHAGRGKDRGLEYGSGRYRIGKSDLWIQDHCLLDTGWSNRSMKWKSLFPPLDGIVRAKLCSFSTAVSDPL